MSAATLLPSAGLTLVLPVPRNLVPVLRLRVKRLPLVFLKVLATRRILLILSLISLLVVPVLLRMLPAVSLCSALLSAHTSPDTLLRSPVDAVSKFAHFKCLFAVEKCTKYPINPPPPYYVCSSMPCIKNSKKFILIENGGVSLERFAYLLVCGVVIYFTKPVPFISALQVTTHYKQS